MATTSLDLTAVRLLVAVDDHGSLGAAARSLHMAQPNASRALSRLERQLGLTLLNRTTTGSSLTASGTVIVHWARKIVDDVDGLLDVASGLESPQGQAMAIGASFTVAEHLMPRWLALLRQAHPDTAVALHVHNSAQVFARLDSGEFDIGFVESPTIPTGFHSTTVAEDRLLVIVSPDHAWARLPKPLRPAELAGTPLVVREDGSGTRTTLEDALDSTLGVDRPQAAPLAELGSSAAIRTAAISAMGPAVLSDLAVADDIASGALHVVAVEGLTLTRRLHAVWRPPRTLAGPVADLVRLARTHGLGT